jgi:hypothetical protein
MARDATEPRALERVGVLRVVERKRLPHGRRWRREVGPDDRDRDEREPDELESAERGRTGHE